jgi:phosphate starvation-inducible PhoH-like protein
VNSLLVSCGAPHQVDIPGGERMSGLNDAVQRLEGVEGIQTIRFNSSDVVRHPLVGRIVDAYEGGND